MCGIYEPHVRSIVILEYLKGICLVYNRIYVRNNNNDKYPFKE